MRARNGAICEAERKKFAGDLVEGLPRPGSVCPTPGVPPHRATPKPCPTICAQLLTHVCRPHQRRGAAGWSVESPLVLLGVTELGPGWQAGKI